MGPATRLRRSRPGNGLHSATRSRWSPQLRKSKRQGHTSSERLLAGDKVVIFIDGCCTATSKVPSAGKGREAERIQATERERERERDREREREREAPSRAAANGEVGKGAGRHQQAIPRSASAFLQSLATATAPEHRQCTPAAETQRGWNVIILQWSCFVRPDLRDLVAEIDVVSQHDLGKPTDQAVAD